MEFQLFHTTLSASLLLFIMAGGFLAGFVDSIAGGGGLISLPVLLAAGLPPHLAIGTNKFSATFGAVMSAWQFWRAGKVDMGLLKRILPGTFVGAVLGCLVMLYLPSEWLQPIIIVALIAAAAFVFTQRQLGAVSTYSGNTRGNVLAALVMALAIGFYDGFIGPGTGTFLIVGFATLGFDFVTAAGNAKILNLMSNVTSFVLLIWWGQILYVYGIAMAVCIFTGAFFPPGHPPWHGFRPPGHVGRDDRPHRQIGLILFWDHVGGTIWIRYLSAAVRRVSAWRRRLCYWTGAGTSPSAVVIKKRGRLPWLSWLGPAGPFIFKAT